MEEELINAIINRLFILTQSNELVWIVVSTSHKSFSCSCPDGETIFKTSITLNEKMSPVNSWIYIHNNKLIDSRFGVYYGQYPQVNDITSIIYQRYIKPIAAKPSQDDVFNSILNSLDKNTRRDNKITTILSNP